MERGENGDDMYYLCSVGGEHYVVFETDYIDPRPYQAKEAVALFAPDEVLGWITKKDVVGAPQKLVDAGASLGEALVSALDGSYLRHAVLKVKIQGDKKHYHPHTYGFTQ